MKNEVSEMGFDQESRQSDGGPGSSSGTPCRLRRQGGFTLIEVMAAFAVFALLFGVVLQVLSTSMQNTRRAGDYTQAALWAQSKLDSVGLERMIEAGRTSGRFDDRFSWTLEISEDMYFDDFGMDAMDLPIALYRVELTVEWGDEHQREAVFTTLRSVDMHWEERQRAGVM